MTHGHPAIGEVVESVSSWNPSKDDPFGDFIYVDLTAVDERSKTIVEPRNLACHDAPSRARRIIRSGDVLVSTVRPNLNTVARVPAALDGATASTGFCVLRPRLGTLDGSYLYHWVRSPQFVFEMTRKATGANYPAVSDRIVRGSKILLPSLREQKRIAISLDAVDFLRAKRRAAQTNLGALIRSVFHDMFGDPATNSNGWPIRNFDRTIRDESSRSMRLPRSEYLPAGRFPVVDQGQAFIAGYCNDERYLCQSVLPVIVFGDHTRAVKLVRKPFVVGADGAKVLAAQSGVNTEFLATLLQTLAIPNLGYSRHMRHIKRMSFQIPPMGLQLEFSKRVRKLDRHRELLDRSSVEIEALFTSLQIHAFRGDL